MITIDQKAPGKIVVNPIILKYAATEARERAEKAIKKGNIIKDITPNYINKSTCSGVFQ